MAAVTKATFPGSQSQGSIERVPLDYLAALWRSASSLEPDSAELGLSGADRTGPNCGYRCSTASRRAAMAAETNSTSVVE